MSKVEGEPGKRTPAEVTNQVAYKSRRNWPMRDFVRWPETAGFPPIRGGSGEELDDNGKKLRPLQEVSEYVKLSPVRLSALIKEGKIRGELRREGRGRGKYYTSISEVREYQENLPTPSDFGRKGALIGNLRRWGKEKRKNT